LDYAHKNQTLMTAPAVHASPFTKVSIDIFPHCEIESALEATD